MNKNRTRGGLRMKRSYKKITAVCLAAFLSRAGILSLAQPVQAAVKAWEKKGDNITTAREKWCQVSWQKGWMCPNGRA